MNIYDDLVHICSILFANANIKKSDITAIKADLETNSADLVLNGILSDDLILAVRHEINLNKTFACSVNEKDGCSVIHVDL